MKRLTFAALALTGLGLALTAYSAPALPGVQLSAPESAAISGGQCTFYTDSCYKPLQNNCTNAGWVYRSCIGNPGNPILQPYPWVCYNPQTGQACCGNAASYYCY